MDIAQPTGYLEGQLLVATPLVTGPFFAKSVIYMFAHNSTGAMGLIINRPVEQLTTMELFDQLSITPTAPETYRLPIHYGGPVEANRGFVIYDKDGQLAISTDASVLRDIAAGVGPKSSMLMLGYAGWSPGQLETEIESNSWISVPPSSELIFDTDNDTKWVRAAQSLGVDLNRFSHSVGHA